MLKNSKAFSNCCFFCSFIDIVLKILMFTPVDTQMLKQKLSKVVIYTTKYFI